tara:strand:- start:585 stop:959 length:375 start_codon:yes stop_codon:yes gene_type:complete
MSIFRKNKDVPELSNIDNERYESIFNVHQTGDNKDEYYFYNILSKITIDTMGIDPDVFEYYTVQKELPWTSISYTLYKTQHLWWLILAVNKIVSPIVQPPPGTVLKVIKAEYIDTVLQEIQDKL